MPTVIAFFNNKGGVGKTTLACNFAAAVAASGRKVLVIDLDPQCNSTQLVLPDESWEEIYGDPTASESQTVLEALKDIRAGDSAVRTEGLPIRHSPRFGIDILPGHPSLSIFEDVFGESWGRFRGGNAGGARRTAWLRVLKESLPESPDLVVLDVSPSLGAINRTALLGSDFFVTPVAADLFSLYALDNIAAWFHRWLQEYENALPDASTELEASGYGTVLASELPIRHGFVGYTVQQYVSRTSGGDIRRIQAYDRHRNEIPSRAARLADLSLFASHLDLGTVPNMFAMVPLAQSQHAPIASLTRDDGLRGAQFNQHQRYVQQLTSIFFDIAQRIGTEIGGSEV